MLMRYIYSLFFYLALPIILLRLLWRARKAPAYQQRWAERFGYLNQAVTKNGIWIHAVSVGETLAAIPLIKALQQKYPALPITVTTTTPTGSERVIAALGTQVMHSYAPYDLPSAVQRFIQQIQPRLLILMETELWPNILHTCAAKKIPVLLTNARLSARSAAGYQRLGKLMREMLKNISLIAAQYEADAARFIALGMDPTRIKITGNIKFDLEIAADLAAKAQQLRTQWGAQRPVWIAASTHEGEEEIVLNAFAKIRQSLPNALLILVPRHPERFARVQVLCQQRGYNVIARSKQQAAAADTDIFLGDTMGELMLFYAASDCAFVGGSLIERGGHNPLEPAALGLPVFMGPHVFNFAVISEQLRTAQALFSVQNADDLATHVLQLLQDKNERQRVGDNGRRVVAQNRGAVAKQLALIEEYL